MVDNIVSAVSTVIAIVAIYLAAKKQPREVKKLEAEAANADADTIKTLYSLIREQEERYQAYKKEQEHLYEELQRDFKLYKKQTSSQLEDIIIENAKLRKWAKKLATQLEQAGIVPADYVL